MGTQAAKERLEIIRAIWDAGCRPQTPIYLYLSNTTARNATQVENDEVFGGMQVEGVDRIAAVDAAFLRIESGIYGALHGV
ncbi:hypothetical protein [Rhizobium laguerreae]|uniref:hypothetical protein n=1 Tax=Rhizobium laguerreae TaxID=1076926 RepID=UPI001FEB1A64|nr:hypothetical protein [Rhizobium laguerreae]